MYNPLVSVLITSYNREKYIGEAIESVLCQTYENFELIILDDCSIDETFNIAQSYQDERIRLYRNDINLGQFPNRNKAADLANGEYLKYLDSDDFMDKNCLKNFIDAILLFPSASLVIEDFFRCITDGFNYELILPSQILLRHYFGGGCLHVGPTFLLIRKSAFFSAGGFRIDRGDLADTDFLLNLSFTNMTVLKKSVDCHWRLHQGQVSFSFNNPDLLWNHAKERFEMNFEAVTTNIESRIKRFFFQVLLKIHYSRFLILNVKSLKLNGGYLKTKNFKIIDVFLACVPIRIIKLFLSEKY